MASGATSPAAEPAGYYVDALLRPSANRALGHRDGRAAHDRRDTNRGRCSHRGDRRGASVDRPDFAMNAAGTFDADDKAYVAQVVSGHTGLSPEEASKRVDTVIAQAREAAEEARKYGIVIAFLYAASMLVSALAAWWSATVGGRHRDGKADYSHLFASRT